MKVPSSDVIIFTSPTILLDSVQYLELSGDALYKSGCLHILKFLNVQKLEILFLRSELKKWSLVYIY